MRIGIRGRWNRLRPQRFRGHAEVSAGRRRRGITPEPAQGPDRLIQHLLALADTAQRDPHLLEFVFVIAHAQPDHQAAIAQRIDVGGHPCQDQRVAVRHAGDERAQPDALCHPRNSGQGDPTIRIPHWVIGDPESVQSELFDLQDELCESGQVTSRTIDDPEADCRTSGLNPRVSDPGLRFGVGHQQSVTTKMPTNGQNQPR